MRELSREELEQLSQDMSRSLGREVRITARGEALDQRTAAEPPVETSTGVAVAGGTLGTVAMVVGLDAKHGSDAHDIGIASGPELLIVAGLAMLGKWQGKWKRRKGRAR